MIAKLNNNNKFSLTDWDVVKSVLGERYYQKEQYIPIIKNRKYKHLVQRKENKNKI